MTQRWPWHMMGSITAILLVYVWLGLFFHSIPLPHVNGAGFLIWLFGSIALSIAAGWRGSKWWYLVTGCFAASLVLLWVGEFLLERHR
jgi:hypothetical protein